MSSTTSTGRPLGVVYARGWLCGFLDRGMRARRRLVASGPLHRKVVLHGCYSLRHVSPILLVPRFRSGVTHRDKSSVGWMCR